jgi:DNA adenine methylase
MRYQGGKVSQSKIIAQILSIARDPNQIYFKPFVGGGSVLCRMSGIRIANDINSDLIALYRAIQIGWEPPTNVSKEMYDLAKDNSELLSPHIRAFLAVGCSYGGKWWGGYAQSDGRNYADESAKNLLKQKPKIQDAAFTSKHYREFTPHGMLIYCDPPYADTTSYDGYGDFDNDEFWETMQVWSQDNTVFVSEYTAPDFCVEVYRWEKKTTLVHKGEAPKRIDKLFLCNSCI